MEVKTKFPAKDRERYSAIDRKLFNRFGMIHEANVVTHGSRYFFISREKNDQKKVPLKNSTCNLASQRVFSF